MTKKDFEVIAEGFAISRPTNMEDAAYSQWLKTKNTVGVALSDCYSNFDWVKFDIGCLSEEK